MPVSLLGASMLQLILNRNILVLVLYIVYSVFGINMLTLYIDSWQYLQVNKTVHHCSLVETTLYELLCMEEWSWHVISSHVDSPHCASTWLQPWLLLSRNMSPYNYNKTLQLEEWRLCVIDCVDCVNVCAIVYSYGHIAIDVLILNWYYAYGDVLINICIRVYEAFK